MYDTKFMLQALQSLEGSENRFTELGKAYSSACQNPLVNIRGLVESGSDADQEVAHEASYDAYMTGAVFINSLQRLGYLQDALKIGSTQAEAVKKKRGRPPKSPPKVTGATTVPTNKVDSKSWPAVMQWISNKYPLGGLGLPFEIIPGGYKCKTTKELQSEPNLEELEDSASLYAKLINLSDPTKNVPTATLKDILESRFQTDPSSKEKNVILYQIFSDNTEVCFSCKEKEAFQALTELVESLGGEYRGNLMSDVEIVQVDSPQEQAQVTDITGLAQSPPKPAQIQAMLILQTISRYREASQLDLETKLSASGGTSSIPDALLY